MNVKNYIQTLILIFGLGLGATAQEMDISLVPLQSDRLDQRCYSITLTNTSQDILLAGQNHRLYYNGHKAKFVESSLQSMLPDTYSKAVLVDHHYDRDASAYGNLLFAHHLSFINFYIDLEDTKTVNAQVISDTPTAVAQFCFVAEDAVDIAFAQRGITDDYATAFVEVAQVIADDKSDNVEIAFVNTSLSTSNDDASLMTEIAQIYPNPFEDILTVSLDRQYTSLSYVEIYNIYGSLVASEQYVMGSQELRLDLSNLTSGAYIVQLIDAEGESIQTFKATKIK